MLLTSYQPAISPSGAFAERARMTKRTEQEVLSDIERRRGEELNQLFGTVSDISAITLIGIKQDKVLELWIKRANRLSFDFIRSYGFTASSGYLGPKLKEGDRQIPEGIYGIQYLNPNSSYYLSIKLDYPNAFDRAKAGAEERTNLGGDIFIHGKSATIGCIPIGDQGIEELFYLISRAGKEKVLVLLSPIDFRLAARPVLPDEISWYPELCRAISERLAPYRRAAVVSSATCSAAEACREEDTI